MVLVLVALLSAPAPEKACGPAALQAFLRALGHKTTEADVMGACRHVARRDDLRYMSVDELVRAARALGAAVTAVRIEPPEHELLPIPAILYLEAPSRGGSDLVLGHFVLIVGKGRNDVLIYDPTTNDPPRRVPLAPLYAHWSGVAIVPGSPVRLPMAILQFATGLVAGLSVFGLVRGAIRRLLLGTPLVLAAVSVAFTSGCIRREPPLTVKPNRVDLGTVRDDRAVVRVTLQAWQRGPVRILDMSRDCAGLRYQTDLRGKVLQPGERASVDLVVAGDGTGRKQVFVWEVLTSPAASGAATVITARFYPRPVLHPNPVRVHVPFGTALDATATVVAVRPAEDPPLDVEVVPDGESPFDVTIGQRISQLHYRDPNGRPVSVRDLQTLHIHVPAGLPLGPHQARYRLRLGQGGGLLTLDVSAHVVHPVQFDQTALYAGTLPVGDRWEYRLPYEELIPGAAKEMRVTPSARWLSAEVVAGDRVLKIQLTVPRVGRFTGKLRVDLATGVPPAWIEVSGIGVEKPARSRPSSVDRSDS